MIRRRRRENQSAILVWWCKKVSGRKKKWDYSATFDVLPRPLNHHFFSNELKTHWIIQKTNRKMRSKEKKKVNEKQTLDDYLRLGNSFYLFFIYFISNDNPFLFLFFFVDWLIGIINYFNRFMLKTSHCK